MCEREGGRWKEGERDGGGGGGLEVEAKREVYTKGKGERKRILGSSLQHAFAR